MFALTESFSSLLIVVVDLECCYSFSLCHFSTCLFLRNTPGAFPLCHNTCMMNNSVTGMDYLLDFDVPCGGICYM